MTARRGSARRGARRAGRGDSAPTVTSDHSRNEGFKQRTYV